MRIILTLFFTICCLISYSQKKKSYDSQEEDYPICIFPTPAKFYGGQKAWVQYLRKNINSNFGNKYITIPKGKTSAKATVLVILL